LIYFKNGANGCSNQAEVSTGIRNGGLSTRFVVR